MRDQQLVDPFGRPGLLFGDSQITVDTLISLRAAAKEIVDHCASPFFWPSGS